MKKTKQLYAILFLSLLTATACNKEKSPDEENPALADYTSMKVNGVFMEDTESGGGYLSGSNNAAISGDFADGSVLYLYIDEVLATGNFNLGAASDDATYTDASGEIFSLSNSGSYLSVTVSEIEPNEVIKGIAGTFEGRLYDDAGNFVEITEGEFSDL